MILLLVDLKVYFLLAKKLKIKAKPVEIVLAAIFGNPKKVNKNNKPKSITVLAKPTTANRLICALFFMLGPYIANNTKTNQLNATKE